MPELALEWNDGVELMYRSLNAAIDWRDSVGTVIKSVSRFVHLNKTEASFQAI